MFSDNSPLYHNNNIVSFCKFAKKEKVQKINMILRQHKTETDYNSCEIWMKFIFSL